MNQAVGFIETKGLTTAIEAADTMLKAANVRILKYRKVGSGLINISVYGNVAAVQTAVDAGVTAALKIGEIMSFYVIARPHTEMIKVIR